MADYTPIGWKNRYVEKPMRYLMTQNDDGTITLERAPGEVYEPGTPVNAANLNHMEEGIAGAYFEMLGVDKGGTGAEDAQGARRNLLAAARGSIAYEQIDEITESGIYAITGTPHMLLHMHFDTTYACQIAHEYSDGDAPEIKIRVKRGGIWEEWHAFAPHSEIIPIEEGGTGATTAEGVRASLGVSFSGEVPFVDIGNITEPGFYNVTSENAKENGTLIHNASNGMYSQIANFHSDGMNLQYRRRYTSGSWGEWQKLFDSSGEVPIANGGTGASDAATARANLGAQKELGFTPVQQGGGKDHGGNKIYLGWSTENKLNVQVDSTNLGNIITDSPALRVILPVNKGGTGARNVADARKNLGVPVVNLLDNSDFTQPVNQRGETSYSAAGYTIDRWRLENNAGTVTVNDGYITLSASGGQCWFVQKFERYLTVGQAYTLYVEFADGTIQASKITVGSDQLSLDANWCILVYQKEKVSLVLSNGNTKIVRRVALYEGEYTTENVPTYQPKGYAHELVECRRYYENSWYPAGKNKQNQTQGFVASTALDTYVKFQQSKRIVPTITLHNANGYSNWIYYNGAYKEASAVGFDMRCGTNGFMPRLTPATGDALTKGDSYTIDGHWEATADL